MLPDRVSNPGPLSYESGALPIATFLVCPEASRKYKRMSFGLLKAQATFQHLM